MAKRLISLKIEHIAGVDKPANKRKFLIVKSEQVDKAVTIEEEPGGAFCIYDNGRKVGTYNSRAAAQAAKDKMTNKGASMLSKEQIAKIKDKDIQEAVVTQLEEMAALETEKKELQAKVEKLEKDQPETEEEKLWKGVNPAIRNRYEALKKEKDDVEKRAAEEKEERLEKEWTQKGEAHEFLQVTPEQYGRLMKKVAAQFPSEAAEIEKIFHLADEAIRKGDLFRSIGSTGGTNGADATSMIARVNALAQEFMKRDKDLTMDSAIEQVFKAHRDWYEPYRKEANQKVG